MTRQVFISILCVLVFLTGKSQSPSDWWYFGDYAGVHFTQTGPVAVLDGALETLEGCASVSNLDGDLLFYTDGKVVYNAQHDTMPHGDSLLGNGSSSQSSVIVPYPGNIDRFCIFTASGCTGGSIGYPSGQSGFLFAFSVVDMSLESGLGDVLLAEKNIILFDSSAEKITATTHANGYDLWLIGIRQDSNRFNAYHLTSSGIVDTVTSNAGSGNPNCTGYMLANHKGDQIAVANTPSAMVQVFDFDQSTGQVLPNPITIDSNVGPAYGLHFSSNDSVLYVGALNNLFQYDLFAPNVQASQYAVTTFTAGSPNYAGLAEGPDGKIYSARFFGPHLSAIENPNVLGAGCGFIDTAVFLQGRFSRYGLPNSVAVGVYLINDVFIDNLCIGEATQFGLDTTGIDSIFWNFGDSNVFNNTSTQFFPSHIYSDTGAFTVQVIVYADSVSDTSSYGVFIYPRQSLELGNDTSLCRPEQVLLDIGQPFSSYIWQDGSTADTFLVSDDSTVYVTLFGVCDTLTDTIMVLVDDSAQIDLGPDTTFCEGAVYLLDGDISADADLVWNTGLIGFDTLLVSSTGTYHFTATNGCGVFSDTAQVDVIPLPATDSLLPPDTINCFDEVIVLERPDNDSITYIWSDSTSKERLEVDSTMTIWLAAENECGFAVDTINIVFNGEIQTELGEDTTLCPDDSIQLFGTDSLASYLWNTGDTTDTIWTTPGEDENYILTVKLGDCEITTARRVLANEGVCPPINCDVEYGNYFTPNGDGLNDRFRVWSDCDVFSFNMAIYNRWGQLVNYTRNVAVGWDGFVNGESAAQGVYYFVLEYKDWVVVDADRQITQGSFTLMR